MKGRILLIFIILFSYFNCYADQSETDFPANCEQTGFVFLKNGIAFNKGIYGSNIYLIKNISNNTILLDHPSSGKGLSAGWGELLQANNYSAINIFSQSFVLICSKKGEANLIPCKDVIKVCRINPLLFESNISQDVWKSVDQSLDNVITKLRNSY